MPTIKRLHRCRIEMYFADHGVPHFHIIDTRDQRASLAIATLTVLAGKVERTALHEARDWARLNIGLLMTNWKKFSG